MKIKLIIAFFGTFLVACNENSEQTDEPTVEHEAIIEQEIVDIDSYDLEIDQELINDIQLFLDTDCERSHITIYQNEDEKILDSGVVFRKVNEDSAYEAFKMFSEDVRAQGNYLFLTNIDYDEDWKIFFDVVILPCQDQFKLIELIQTQGFDTNIQNEDILAKMRKWDKLVGFNVVYCDNSGIDAYMDTLPEDIESFAAEVYEFCPYVIDEDAKTMEAYIEKLRKEKYFYLWWGVSFK